MLLDIKVLFWLTEIKGFYICEQQLCPEFILACSHSVFKSEPGCYYIILHVCMFLGNSMQYKAFPWLQSSIVINGFWIVNQR